MTHITESPDANPPDDGYETALTSTIYKPIAEALHALMQASGDFDFVSTYWTDPDINLSDAQFPAVATVPSEFPIEPWGIGSVFKENQEWVTIYNYKHFRKVVLEEGYYVAEKLFDIIVNNRHMIAPGGTCNVLKATPVRVEWDVEIEGEFALNEVRFFWTAEVKRQ